LDNNLENCELLLINLVVIKMRKLTSTNYHNQAFLQEKCALNELIYLLSKRWVTDVLFSIEEGNNRFSSLKDDLKHISDNVLAERLKALEQHGLIIRNDNFKEVPARVEYLLTPNGEKLSELLDGMCQFAEDHMNFPS
jgi:DNA-binding HxlR family transcriptional regulator